MFRSSVGKWARAGTRASFESFSKKPNLNLNLYRDSKRTNYDQSGHNHHDHGKHNGNQGSNWDKYKYHSLFGGLTGASLLMRGTEDMDLAERWEIIKKFVNKNHTFFGFLGVNLSIFLTWRLAYAANLPRLLRFMNNHFVCSYDNIMKMRLHTFFTSAFSHITLPHFLINHFCMFSVLPALGILDAKDIVGIYILSGGFSSFAHLLWHFAWRIPTAGVVGASGSLFALFAIHSMLYPTSKWSIIFFPFVEIDGSTMLKAMIGLETVGLFHALLSAKSPTYRFRNVLQLNLSHMGHLGGIISGLVAGNYYVLPKIREMLRRQRMSVRNYLRW